MVDGSLISLLNEARNSRSMCRSPMVTGSSNMLLYDTSSNNNVCEKFQMRGSRLTHARLVRSSVPWLSGSINKASSVSSMIGEVDDDYVVRNDGFRLQKNEIISGNRPTSNSICVDAVGERKQAPSDHSLMVIVVIYYVVE